MKRKIAPPLYFDEVRRIEWFKVISKFGIKIRKRGSGWGRGDYITRCPFHCDKSPSMHFYNNIAGFCCYGCGNSGDVFEFVRIMLDGRHGDRILAYRWFKKNFGIPLPWEKKKK